MGTSKVQPLFGAEASFDRGSRPPKRIGKYLMENYALDPDDLARALTFQKSENAKLGEILVGRNMVSADHIQNAISRQYGLTILDPDRHPPEQDLFGRWPPELLLRLSFAPWRKIGSRIIFALSDPTRFDEIVAATGLKPSQVGLVLTTQHEIKKYVALNATPYFSDKANNRCPEGFSCRNSTTLKFRLFWAAVIAVCSGIAVLFPALSSTFLLFWIGFFLVANTALKLTCALASTQAPNPLDRPKNPPLSLDRLPKITLFVPLLREESILERLIERMTALTYPRELLDICLILEENDQITRRHIATHDLPAWMRVLVVPENDLQTKPRAMNYALEFSEAPFIGIYDAEDAPEPGQLENIIQHFQSVGPEVACLQGILDFYNPGTNWISRCFTIEYALWFRILLRGVDHLNLPLPLGGTTVFFRREALEQLGAWDAHNVTEDADLGIRLCRKGYRCEWTNTVTYEEANYRLVPWIKQRSRWLKGYMLTWMTHMRNPVRLFAEFGLKRFLAFNVMFLGAITSYLFAPLVWPLWLLSLGIEVPIYRAVDASALFVMMVLFIGAEFVSLALAATAIRAKGRPGLLLWIPAMTCYWPIGSLAAYKAVYELFAKPLFWDKTQHGIEQDPDQFRSCEPGSVPADSPIPAESPIRPRQS